MRAFALALVVALSPPAFAEEYEVVPHCAWRLTSVPGETTSVFALLAEAHATGPTPAATTTVTCTVTNPLDETVTASGSSVGDHVYAASSRIMTFAPPEYCVSARSIWTDPITGTVTHEEIAEEVCEDIDW